METACFEPHRPTWRDACQPQVVNSMLRPKRAGTDDWMSWRASFGGSDLSSPPPLPHTPLSQNPYNIPRITHERAARSSGE